jgi:tetratricopeptide (TPR) repeat protein
MYRLSVVLQNQNLFDEADGLLRQVLSTQRRLQEVDSLDTLTTMGDLATLYDRQGRYDRAAELWNEIYSATNQLATEGTLDPGYPEQRGRAMGRLTDLYERMGRYEKVEELLLEGLRGWLEAYGEDYPAVHGIKYRLARMAALQGNRSRSLDLLQELEGQYSVLRDVRVDVAFESLHGDPRFDAIVLALDKLEQPDVDSGNRK